MVDQKWRSHDIDFTVPRKGTQTRWRIEQKSYNPRTTWEKLCQLSGSGKKGRGRGKLWGKYKNLNAEWRVGSAPLSQEVGTHENSEEMWQLRGKVNCSSQVGRIYHGKRVLSALGGVGTTPGEAGRQGEGCSSEKTWDANTMKTEDIKLDWRTYWAGVSLVRGDSEKHLMGSQHVSLQSE